ncbi:MAG TPA: hypothetical protein VGR16_13890 [Thermomicrobiales bacterium]|nr:hypothetical protein [Thermomicrobiales bacterium]
MTETYERTTPREDVPEPTHAESPPIDADESGALAIGLMVAIVIMVALLTLALFISIP